MQRLLVRGLLICGFCLLFVQPSHAQVTYTLSGHVTSFNDPGGTLFPPVSPGDTLTGTVMLNPNQPGFQSPFDGNVGIFLHLPGVNFTWFEFNYAPPSAATHWMPEVRGTHFSGFSDWDAVDVGSDLFLHQGGSWSIDGLEGATGENWEVKGVFDSVTSDQMSTVPEGNSNLLLATGLIVPGLAFAYARRKQRKAA